MKKKRLVSLFTLIIMLLNMFSPYSVLFNNVTMAALNVSTNKPFVLANLGHKVQTNGDVLTVQIGITSSQLVKGGDIQFSVDLSKLQPCTSKGKASTTFGSIAPLTALAKEANVTTIQSSSYKVDAATSTGTYRITFTQKSEGQNLSDIMNEDEDLLCVPGESTYADVNNMTQYDNYYPFINLYFTVVDPSIDINNPTSDLITLKPVGSSLPTGLSLVNGSNVTEFIGGFDTVGFAEPEEAPKTIKSITVKTMPTNPTEHGNSIDLTGGVITIEYDDESLPSEDIPMTDPDVTLTSSSGNLANVNNTAVTLSYGKTSSGQPATVSFNINVTDPLTNLYIKSPMAVKEYNQGNSFDFTGLELEAKRKSGATIPLTQSSENVTTSSLVADVNLPSFTLIGSDGVTKRGTQAIIFTYSENGITQSAKTTVVVNDTVSGIRVIKQPTKTIYKVGENLELSGAQVEITLGSGGHKTINLPDGSITVGGFSNTTTGSKQHLSVSYGSNTADETIDVEAYNYISSSTFKAPTNLYPTYNQELDLSGSLFSLVWKKGSPTTISLPNENVTITGYNKTKVNVAQRVTATYSTKYVLSDGTEIPDTVTGTFDVVVSDKAKTITITAPTKTTYTHGQSINTAGSLIEVVYESGNKLYPTVTLDIIKDKTTGNAVNMSPSVSAYEANNNVVSRTAVIEYTEDGVKGTAEYSFTIENNITGIRMGTIPTKVDYKLKEDTYDLTNTSGTLGTDGTTKYGDIIVVRAAGDAETVPLDNSEISLTNLATLTNSEGTGKTVTVTYKGQTTSFNINVADGITGVLIEGTPSVTAYDYGDTIDLTGVSIYVQKASDSVGSKGTPVALSSATITDITDGEASVAAATTSLAESKFTSNVATRTIRIAYSADATHEAHLDYQITVKNTVDHIEITTSPKNSYSLSEDTTSVGGQITIYRKANTTSSTETKDIEDSWVSDLSTANATPGKKATVTYKEDNGKGVEQSYTDKYTYTVVDTINGVEIIGAPTKTVYNHGEALDWSGVTIKVKYASGDQTASITDATITDITNGGSSAATTSLAPEIYTANHTLSTENSAVRTIRIYYAADASHSDYKDYTITINNNIKSIRMGTIPTKTNYKVKDSTYDLTNASGTLGADGTTKYGDIIVERAAGNTQVVPLDAIGMSITPLSSLTNSDGNGKKVTITYGLDLTGQPFTTGFNIDVEDYITGVTIEGTPTKSTYNHGETLDWSGVSIYVQKASDSEGSKGTPVAITSATITDITNGGSSTATTSLAKTDYTDNVATRTIRIAYSADATHSDSKDYDITVNNNMTGIKMGTVPVKINYKLNETNYVLTNGDIIVVRGAGDGEVISLEDSEVSLTDLSTLTTSEGMGKTVTVTYKGETTTFNINVADGITGVVVEGTPTKTTYNHGEAIDLTGVEIYVKKASSAPGSKGISVNLSDAIVTDITNGEENAPTATTLLAKTDYTNNTTTRTIRVYYAVDSTYNDYKDYEITINNNITGIRMGTAPTKVEYKMNETSYDLTNASGTVGSDGTTKYGDIIVVRGAGDGETIPLDDSEISLTDISTLTSSEGTKAVTVTYKGETTSFNINVSDGVTGVTIEGTPTKTTYNHGEALDFSGVSIYVGHASDSAGSKGTLIPVTSASIKDITNGEENAPNATTSLAKTDYTNNVATRTIRVSYTIDGHSASEDYEITVNNNITGIRMGTTPTKVDYKLNETTYDLTNGDIIVVRGAGDGETVSLDNSEISLTDLSTLTSSEGTKEVTVTYKGETAKFNINVADGITGVTIEGTPSVTAYDYGDALDFSGIKIYVHKASDAAGSKGTLVPLTSATITDETETSMAATTSLAENKFTSNIATRTIRVAYSADASHSASEDYEITVKNTVDHITVTTSPKNSYELNESTANAGGQITIYRKANTTSSTEIQNIQDSWITNLNTTVPGASKTATVTYKEHNGKGVEQPYTDNYTYNVLDDISSIDITGTPTKLTYNHGDEINLSGLTITVNYGSGPQNINLSDATILDITDGETGAPEATTSLAPTDYTNYVATRTIRVYYEVDSTHSAHQDFTITVNDNITSVTITAPSKIDYDYNEDLDLSDSTIEIVRASTPDTVAQTIPVDAGMISGYDKTALGAQTVTINYTDSEGTPHSQSFGVTVSDALQSIAKKDTGFKKQYKYGENLDLTNLSLDVTRAVSGVTNIPVTTGMISGYDPHVLGTQTLAITYEGLPESVDVEVVDYVIDVTLVPPTKDEYKLNETLSLTGGKIVEIMASGSAGREVDLTSTMVSALDTSTFGVKRLTVTYPIEGRNAEKYFDVAVVNTVNHIVVTPPTKTDYKYGEPLDLTGGSIDVVMEDGTTSTLPITKDMVSGFDSTNPGQQMITVTYTDDKGNEAPGYFRVTIGEDYVKELRFTAPSKKAYKLGDTLDVTGGCITEVYASGKLGNKIDVTSDMTTGFNSTTPGTKTIVVAYEDKQYSYKVSVEDKVLGISINNPLDKLEYKQGQAINVAGGKLNVVKQSGTYVVDITKDMISGYDSNKTGIQTVKVTYQGFTVDFNVLVEKATSTTPSGGRGKTPTGTGTITGVTPENPEEPVKEDPNKDLPSVEDSVGIVGITNNNNNNNGSSGMSGAVAKNLLMAFGTILGLSGILLILFAVARDRDNVKVYIEEGNERVLIGKEKVTTYNRKLDLSKYYKKYKEDEYKIVLSKSISKKLDNKTVNVIVHDKKEESFEVKYENEAYSYKTY